MVASRRLTLLALVAACLGCDTSPRTSWRALLAPLAPGRDVARAYLFTEMFRGHEHDVVIVATRPNDGRRVEVHVLPRGRWWGVRETASCGVAWEVPHTTAPREDAEAVTASVARALRGHDRGGLIVEAIPLDLAEPVAWWRRGLPSLAHIGTTRVVPWWLFAGLLAWGALWRRVRVTRDDVLLGVWALAARVAFGAWTPFHVNGQGPLWIDGALHPDALRAYGPGYSELFGLAARLGPPDRFIFALNAFENALLAPLVATLARRLGLSPPRALFAGALVAAAPAFVRFAATESYLTAVTLLPLVATLLALAAWDAHSARARGRAVALLLASGLLAAQAARVHPTAAVGLSLAPLLVLAGATPRAALITAATFALSVTATSACVLADVAAHLADGHVARPTATTGALAPALVLVALGVSLPRSRRLAPALALAAAWAPALLATYNASSAWALAALHALAAPAALTLAAWVPEVVTQSSASVRPWAVGAAFVFLASGWSVVRVRTTDAMEYDWARRTLPRHAQGCRVVWVAFAGPRRTVFLPTWTHGGTSLALDTRTPGDPRALLRPLDCTVYVRTTACDTPDGRPACARIESLLTLRPLGSTVFPAVASHRSVGYTTTTLTAGMYRVVALRERDVPVNDL